MEALVPVHCASVCLVCNSVGFSTFTVSSEMWHCDAMGCQQVAFAIQCVSELRCVGCSCLLQLKVVAAAATGACSCDCVGSLACADVY